MHLFTPNHVQLLNSCYPPTSALPATGPQPNAQELSRLTYYASNHPSKLTKLGSELEKRLRNECKKAKAGNARYRTMLLVTLDIIRSLANECRRDIGLFSPFLITSVEVTLTALITDLEVVARAATVFTTWTTYTDGHLIGADGELTQNYTTSLRHFAHLSCSEKEDQEMRNRTRLIGLAALSGAISSEALYNDTTQFREQISIILRPLILNIYQTPLAILDEQANTVKEGEISPYLAGFRTRPALERRAASIHVHIDGENGPSTEDVINATLHALYSLLEHANGSQLGSVMQSCFNVLDQSNCWVEMSHCRWLAQKLSEWAQYQYRYAAPTLLVERMLQNQETPAEAPNNQALVAMVTTVFNSSIPHINLSTSDIIANLISLLLRRASLGTEPSLLTGLIDSITSLGRHIYYADQILDLAGEVISRLVLVETQGVPSKVSTGPNAIRSTAVRCLTTSLLGLLLSAEEHDNLELANRKGGSTSPRTSVEVKRDPASGPRTSRRTRVTLDLWQDTLSLLCDDDYAVRADYARVLIFYISKELPSPEDPVVRDSNNNWTHSPKPISIHVGDNGIRFLNAVHAYAYVLSMSTSLGLGMKRSTSPSDLIDEGGPVHLNVIPATPMADRQQDSQQVRSDSPGQPQSRRSLSLPQASRARKVSVVQKLFDRTSPQVCSATTASVGDYAHILSVICALYQQMPIRGLLTGVPMLLALNATLQSSDAKDPAVMQRTNIIKELMTRVWLLIGEIWDLSELVDLATQALATLPSPHFSRSPEYSTSTTLSPPQVPVPFPETTSEIAHVQWNGIEPEHVIPIVVSSLTLQGATGLSKEELLQRLTIKWTATAALRDSVDRTSCFDFTLRGDGVSPLLKISPALMHIENISLQSLARSTRGVGVTDLREALEGRNGMSSSNLGQAASISTLDHTSVMGGELNRLARSRSRTRAKKRPAAATNGEVRDVLNRLGIRKPSGSLLKTGIPPVPKSAQQTSE